MASSSVLAIYSLSSDGMMHLSTNEHTQFKELANDYFNASGNGSDDDSSESDDQME